MFHTYVLTQAPREGGGCCVVDFDRASYLMDRDLLQASLRAMLWERNTCPRHDADYGAQWVWDYYCGRHFDRYGEAFLPDVTADWDGGCRPSDSGPSAIGEP